VLELLDLKAVLIIVLIFLPLERLFPLHPEQKILRRHWANDLVYLFFNSIAIKMGFLLLLGLLMTGARLAVPAVVTTAIRAQPVWLQTIEVIVIADVGFYLAHRAFHVIPLLWQFHAIHHSIEEMDWLAAHRVHPVDQVLTKTASVLPVFALGFSDVALAIFAFSYQCQSLLIHSNVRVGFGPLKWVLASPEFHHWHHANEEEAFDKNFAAQLPFLDALGGTLFLPRKRMPVKYGTDDPVPTMYHQQLAYPLRLRRPAATRTVADEGRDVVVAESRADL
jgi:sterol desaturase/sphingolipid hydroxylase (fatty acid hydroxylase superfamily)